MPPKTQIVRPSKSKKDEASDDEVHLTNKKNLKSRKYASESEDITSDESPVKKPKKKIAKSTAKRTRDDDDSIDEKKDKKKPKKGDLKLDAVMVIYDVDDSMPDLKLAYNGKSGTLLLSELFELNQKVKKSDVCRIIDLIFK